MTNKIAVEIATDYSIDIVDIRGILRSKIDDLDITLIDMTQYVSRAKVEEMMRWLEGALEQALNGVDVMCRFQEAKSMLDEAQESETQGDVSAEDTDVHIFVRSGTPPIVWGFACNCKADYKQYTLECKERCEL
jgi:hypothetical protein